MLIYIDLDYKCHTSNDGTMRSFEVPFFDGKCPAFVEGHWYVPPKEVFVDANDNIIRGEMISPWRDLALLDEFQAQYEAQLMAAAAAYAEGVNSI